MTEIIQLHNYTDSTFVERKTQEAEAVEQEFLAMENEELTKQVSSLESHLEQQASLNLELKSQVKEVQAENEILLGALQEDVAVPLLTTPTQAGAVNGYWEQEYCLLKEKIRHMEAVLAEKETELHAANSETENLLNELLAKS